MSLESWLKENKLGAILSVLNENDISSMEDLQELENEKDVIELGQELGLKVVQKKKFKKAVLKLIGNTADPPQQNTQPKEHDEKQMEIDEKQIPKDNAKVPVMIIKRKPKKANEKLVSEIIYHDRSTLSGVFQVPFTQERPSLAIQTGKKNRTILVVGATGTGKTTALNSMINYLWNVKYDDKFRYKLIIEDFSHTQAESMTQDVTSYYLEPPKLNYTLCVVDTPGFGDTSGVKKDNAISQKIKEFFETKIQEIDAICFVVRAPQARLTAEQQYIFNKVLGLFGKDIKENIFILINFCDAKKPPVLAALKKDNIPFEKNFKLNNSAFDLPEDKEEMEMGQLYWIMGMKAFEKLFIELGKTPTKTLALTKKVLTRRQELECYIEGVDPLIRKGFTVLQQMRDAIQAINANTTLVDKNKNFEIVSWVDHPIEVPTANNTTTCIGCPSTYTCHKSCVFSDSGEKQHCAVMNGGYCTVCPNKCHWTQHRNLPYILKYEKKKNVKTIDELKKVYYDAKSKVSISDQLIAGLTGKLAQVENDVNNLIHGVRQCVNELSDIALRPNTLSQDDYIDQMMENEKNKRDPGWQQRVKALNGLRAKQNRLKEIHSSQYNPWAKYDDVQDYLQNNKDKYKQNKNHKNKSTMQNFFSWFT